MKVRGVSTVVDATLALLLVSASVFVAASFLADDRPETNPGASDHVAETVSVSTANVSYSLEPIVGHLDDVDFRDETYDEGVFRRQRHGSVAELIASSAMLNVTIEGRQLTKEGEIYSDAVEGALMETLTGTGYSAYVTARWRPYEGASITATETYGSPPPGDADVQLATLRVPSGVEPVAVAVEGEYMESYANGHEQAARVLAEAIVERYVPASEMQVALEGQWFRRDLALYRYLRLKAILNEFDDSAGLIDGDDVYYYLDPDDEGTVLSRNGANATRANAYLARGSDGVADFSGGADGLKRIIGSDLEDHYADDEMASFVAASSIEDVVITIRVWEQ
ncbi:DUF7284 family protein [Halapricum desulfuricans]|uniref:Putative pilin/flagellin n=1 Tax=Halapricum desulfuricans TaxID=2841257 RepID=A0A897N7N2_9EURY|nr:hypothetical protein [Halapricum desulfuricans]QSG08802.1 putative pilin/flagellin [Halapricum desulfuricans]